MSKRIVIVGGGVNGLCVAHYALRRGHRVTVLERGAADHDSCSLGNAGMIVPSHFTPLAAPGMVALVEQQRGLGGDVGGAGDGRHDDPAFLFDPAE